MPFELEPVEVEDELVAPAPPDELDDEVVGLLEAVEEPELEFEPQAARPRTARTRRAAAERRGDLVMVAFIIAPLCEAGKLPGYDLDAGIG